MIPSCPQPPDGISQGDKNEKDDPKEVFPNLGGFGEFLERNGIDVEWYMRQTNAFVKNRWRYIRVNQLVKDGCSLRETEDLLNQVFEDVNRVEWLPGHFFQVPAKINLKGLDIFESGQLYGLDAASGAAVCILNPKPGERVLDLACAPGGKFAFIADLMKRKGKLVGVDVAAARLNTCVSVCKKYGVCRKQPNADDSGADVDWDCSVVLGDGTKFSDRSILDNTAEIFWCPEADKMLYGDSEQDKRTLSAGTKRRKRVSRTMRKHINRLNDLKRQKRLMEDKISATDGLYDRVLVDAECTHDGSFKHMQKYTSEGVFGIQELEKKFINTIDRKCSDGIDSLQQLQRGLLLNGFENLRPGGVLVYSTCSFCRSQNEDIVGWLLKKRSSARLQLLSSELEFEGCKMPISAVESRNLNGTLYFCPIESQTSGLYVAKLMKADDQ